MDQPDHLTGLLTRRTFDADVPRRFTEASVACPAVLVMADIDHFKKINDTRGHPVGDGVLKGVAGALEPLVDS